MFLPGLGFNPARDLLRGSAHVFSEPIAAIRSASQSQTASTAQTPPGLVFVGKHDFQFFPRQILSVTGGGITYGDASLTADRVTVYVDDPTPGEADQSPAGTVVAEGHAVLTNPVGRIAAEGIKFNYLTRTGTARSISVEQPGILVTAASAEVFPDLYVLHDVVAHSPESPPVYLIHARQVDVRVGNKLVATHASLSLFGRKIYTFPKITRSLDERVSGLNYPTLTLNSSFQPGISYNSSELLSNTTAAAGSYQSEHGSFPSYSLQLSKSTVDPGQTAGFITPRTDLDERFGFGYFDNVDVRNPINEYNYVAAKRETLSVGSFWNRGTVDRLNYQVFTKPIELSFEKSFAFGPIKTLSQASIDDVRLEHSEGYLQSGVPYGSDHIRFVAQSVAEIPPWHFTPELTGHIRLAGSTFDGGGHSFSWVQGEAGAVYRLPRYFRVAGAMVLASEFGDPLFLSDHLYSKNGFNMRADFSYGPRTISVLSRWDFDRNRFYDHELMFTQLSGLFQPFLAIRSFPGSFRIGVQLRVDNVLSTSQHNPTSRPSSINPNAVD